MSIKLVTFVGMPGAGKSYCVDYMKGKGLPAVYFGGITLDEVKARGLELTESNEKLVREEIRAKEGKGAYANRIIEKIEALSENGDQTIIVDGLYSWTEYKTFKDKFGKNVIIIAITAPRHMRHQRLAKRPVRPLNDQEVTSREYAEIENLEKGGPIANADYTIVNDGSPEDLASRIEEILKQENITDSTST